MSGRLLCKASSFGFVLAALIGLGSSSAAVAATTVLSFEEVPEGSLITNQYENLGVTASGAVVASSDNLGWPFNSQFNLAYAPTGYMSFNLNSTIIGNVQSVSAYISGYSSVGIYAYDSSGNVVGQAVTGGFSQNMFLTLVSSGNPITSIEIHDGGTAFAVDDLSFESVPIIEPPPVVVSCLDLGQELYEAIGALESSNFKHPRSAFAHRLVLGHLVASLQNLLEKEKAPSKALLKRLSRISEETHKSLKDSPQKDQLNELINELAEKLQANQC